MSREVVLKVKEEIEKLLKASFIKLIKYSQWLSNIELIIKKNGKLPMCIDSKDPSVVTPKDIYIIPIANMLVDAATKNELLSFFESFSSYNQIFITPEDVSKTAFRCPGSIETFEWLIMPF